MFKAKECCCGCTLRTGNLILLWISLCINACGALIYLGRLSSRPKHYYEPKIAWQDIYFLFWCIVGIIVSITAIFGIQSNKPKFLIGYLYYLSYKALYYLYLTLAIIIHPPLYHRTTELGIMFSIFEGIHESSLVMVAGHMFVFALIVYFLWIVKSNYHEMLTTKNNSEYPDHITS